MCHCYYDNGPSQEVMSKVGVIRRDARVLTGFLCRSLPHTVRPWENFLCSPPFSQGSVSLRGIIGFSLNGEDTPVTSHVGGTAQPWLAMTISLGAGGLTSETGRVPKGLELRRGAVPCHRFPLSSVTSVCVFVFHSLLCSTDQINM